MSRVPSALTLFAWTWSHQSTDQNEQSIDVERVEIESVSSATSPSAVSDILEKPGDEEHALSIAGEGIEETRATSSR